jgi:rhamnose transport system substrate-binding protein
MLPKFTSDPYFVAVNQGAQEAAKELQVTVEFNGPVDANVAAQANIIDQWIRAGMDAITVSANDPNALAPAMERAARRGIKVSTFLDGVVGMQLIEAARRSNEQGGRWYPTNLPAKER